MRKGRFTAPFSNIEDKMDIQAIEDNIKELENGITNVDNVQELANLYIVREYIVKTDTNPVEKEINDILPAYNRYSTTKCNYQLNKVSEDAVVHDMELLCQELKDFIIALYSNTNFFRERRILISTIQGLQLD